MVFRSPARLALLDSGTGAVKDVQATCGDSDDVFFDNRRQRIYVSCGSGAVDVFDRSDGKHRLLARINGQAPVPAEEPARVLYEKATNPELLAWIERNAERARLLSADEVDELRILATYLASHPDTPQLVLDPVPEPDGLTGFAQPNGSSTTSAGTLSWPTETVLPGGASRRTSASPIGPNRGETATLFSVPTDLSSNVT